MLSVGTGSFWYSPPRDWPPYLLQLNAQTGCHFLPIHIASGSFDKGSCNHGWLMCRDHAIASCRSFLCVPELLLRHARRMMLQRFRPFLQLWNSYLLKNGVPGTPVSSCDWHSNTILGSFYSRLLLLLLRPYLRADVTEVASRQTWRSSGSKRRRRRRRTGNSSSRTIEEAIERRRIGIPRFTNCSSSSKFPSTIFTHTQSHLSGEKKFSQLSSYNTCKAEITASWAYPSLEEPIIRSSSFPALTCPPKKPQKFCTCL